MTLFGSTNSGKMAGNQLIFAVVITLFAFWCEAKLSSSELEVSYANNPFEQQCTWFFRANPDDCRTYYQCLHGRSVLRRCPRSLHWNPEGHLCDYQARSSCKAGKPNTGISKNAILEVYDPIKAYLKRKNKRECPPNTYQSHPSDCGKFMQCTDNSFHVYDCPAGLYWDNTHKVCNWPYMVSCSQASASGSESGVAVAQQSVTTSTTSRPTTVFPLSTSSTTSTLAPFIPPFPTTSGTTQRPTAGTELTTVPTRPPGRPPSDGRVVVCYFTNWSVYRPDHGKFTPSEIDPSKCTHIIYAFACLSATTFKLEPCDNWIDTAEGKNFYGQITAFRKLGIKVTVAVGGWNDSGYAKWNQMLKDPQKMDTFVRSVAVFLEKYNFQGIDLDYEYPVCPQTNCNLDSNFEKQAFVALIKGLRFMCGPDAILSAAVSCNENIIKEAYDVPTMSKYLDFIHLMAYDFHGAWESKTGINAPLKMMPTDDAHYLNTQHAVTVFKSMGAPANKLVLGMPTYGQTFLLENAIKNNGLGAPAIGPGFAGPCTKQKGVLAYYEICSSNWTRTVFDEEHRVGPYRYNINDGTWVSHEGPGVIKAKCDYIKEEGMGGAMIWSLDFDDFSGRCGEGKYPLLNFVNLFMDDDIPTSYKDNVIREYKQRSRLGPNKLSTTTTSIRHNSKSSTKTNSRTKSSSSSSKKGQRTHRRQILV